jgi:hypothetical protein
MTPTPPPRPVEWPLERSRNMTARIAAAWPRCSGWVTPLPVRLRKVHRRAGDRYAADRDERGPLRYAPFLRYLDPDAA